MEDTFDEPALTRRRERVDYRVRWKGEEDKVDPEAKQRIKQWMMWCMVCTAGFIDILDVILALVVIGDIGGDSILSIVADLGFIVWFKLLGADFIGKKNVGAKLSIMGGQAIIEAIPLLQALPMLTVAVYLTCKITRSEDGGGIIGKAASVAEGISSGRMKK